jgi:hypothetical protein
MEMMVMVIRRLEIGDYDDGDDDDDGGGDM